MLPTTVIHKARETARMVANDLMLTASALYNR
jgi:hypothetical protein